MKALYVALAFFPLIWLTLAISTYAANKKKADYIGATSGALMACFVIWALVFFIGLAFA